MGFSIGGLLGAAGALLPGPIGIAASIAGAGFGGGGGGGSSSGPLVLASASPGGREAIARGLIGAGSPASQIPLSLRAFSGAATQVQGRFPLPVPRMPAPFPLGPIIGGAIIGAIAQILAEARQNTGRPVSARKIRDAAKFCGLETAASMFGLTVEQVCQVVIAKTRRRRGISASDLRRTRSTIRKINTMRKSLKKLGAR